MGRRPDQRAGAERIILLSWTLTYLAGVDGPGLASIGYALGPWLVAEWPKPICARCAVGVVIDDKQRQAVMFAPSRKGRGCDLAQWLRSTLARVMHGVSAAGVGRDKS